MRGPLMRKLLQCCALVLAFSWVAPIHAAELSSPPSAPKAKKTSYSSEKDELGGSRLLQPDTEIIDVPTASIIDYGSFSSRSRFFSNGGVLEWLSFGVFQRLNVGAAVNVDKFIGNGTPVQITRPTLQAKFRFYDGTPVLPALAVGFDGQGYLYNRVDHRYDQRDHGLYLVGSQEIFVPGLQVHAGFNIPDFDNNPLFGFTGIDYNIEDKLLLMAEWDNINNFLDSRFNTGFRVYVTTNFNIDFSVRAVGQGGTYSNGFSRGAERVVTLKYTGNF